MKRLAIAVVCACASLASGCISVAAYERERLAHPAMNDGVDPEGDAMAAHVAGAREAALRTGAGAGGGCGCD